MIAAVGLSNEIIVALIAAVPAAIWAYLAWARTGRMDENTKQAGIAAGQAANAAQVVEGLTRLITAQQVELQRLYRRIDELENGEETSH